MSKEKWLEEHSVCPKCGSLDVFKTNQPVNWNGKGEYYDSINKAKCNKCDWKGMVKQLKPAKKGTQIKAMIRTLDHDEGDGKLGVYLNGYDMLETLESFAHALVDNLKDEQTIEYTKSLMNEIFKVITGTMLEHTKKRFEQAELNNQKEENNVDERGEEGTVQKP